MIARNASNPVLFACGVPRSGTTLLQRMLNSHPDLTVANDTHFIPRALELTSKNLIVQATNSIEISLTDELADNVFNYHRFYRTGLSESEFIAIRARASTYRELVGGVFDCIADKENKSLAGEKTPDYVRRIRLLNRLFPDAKLIHLIRDGRNVALSLLDWATPKKGPGRIELWNESPIAVCALWWKWLVDQGLEQAKGLNDSVYCEVKYEDLTDSPEPSVRELCDFLQLPFDEAMLQFNKGRTSSNPDLSAKSAWLGPKTGLRDWRRDMDAADVELFEALAGDTLQRCGYELSTQTQSAAVQQIAENVERWWRDNFLSKHTERSNTEIANQIDRNFSTATSK